jgi:YYY domain-containing protein
VVFDWLGREGWIILNWWILATVTGVTVLPMLVRLLCGLPDRGYTLARPVGMLLVGFVFWFLAILGFVDNSPGSILLSWLIVLGASFGIYFTANDFFDWREWRQENRTVIIASEILFVSLLVIWAIFRAYQHDLSTTEKPMDLAFMSAIQRSATFPPNDPWLAGYSISYYYFGYVMAAAMSMLVGVPSTIGFNAHIALLFALAGTTTFGLGYNLVRSRAFRLNQGMRVPTDRRPSAPVAVMAGLLAMVFMIWMGNFHLPLVEMPYQSGLASESYLEFWDAPQRDTPLDEFQSHNSVDQWSYWWWFRAARAIGDKSLDDGHIEVIAEFPQFSFLLADSHPHMMALPFALMVMGLALNTTLVGKKPDARQTLFYGICVGALIFLNTWDAPIYLSLLIGAEALRRILQNGRLKVGDWGELTTFGISLLAIAILAYLPFIVGFRSQLQGILPNVINPTQFPQLFLMFGPFFLILLTFLLVEAWRGKQAERMNWRFGLVAAGSILLMLVTGLLLLLIIGWNIGDTRHTALNYINAHGGWDEVLPTIFSRWVGGSLTSIVLLIMLVLVAARLFPRQQLSDFGQEKKGITYPPATGFVLVLIGMGVMLILLPEFVYLRDNFSTRMNTVFKFYYQAWAAFSIAGAYAVYTILADVKLARPSFPVQAMFGVMLVAILFVGLWYPVLGIYHRMFVETGRNTGYNDAPLTLDGGPGLIDSDDYNVLICLGDLVGQVDTVVAEANPQGDRVNYNPRHGRVGTLTGIPVLIGWPGHESQWRGSGYSAAVGTRRTDLDILYTDLRMDVVSRIIDQYDIDYILYGTVEHSYYAGAGEEKFRENFEVVCESGNSRVYRVTTLLDLPSGR